ncbi:caspase-1 isoform X2 [Folsomia candida]|uniref:Caspase-1 n=1 Tax=Folsomia candida TaxID=158441 RepID=A0A226ER05_FOLCA|nr:caspase-1 isoform X2 [Folsomia candida]OXA60052.1 Caspase-1 [Folsomia candida]
MSAILRCFSRKRSDSLSLDKEKSGKKVRNKKCKCKCKCRQNDDLTDGKSFSKTLHISEKKCKRHSVSCCESSMSDANPPSQYSSIPSPTASVDPMGTPFFMTVGEATNLPGKSYMPVSKDDPNYNMNHPRRGKAIIFNFDRWDNTNIPHLGLSPRIGSEKDKKDLARCLQRLDFQVEEHDNLKHLQFWAVLERVRKEDHTDADCLVVVVMTHGEKNTVYMRDGVQIPINLCWENFEANKCPSLAGKPKIFIVQACRGKSYDSGTLLHPAIQTDLDVFNRSDVTDSSTFSYVIPNAADIVIAFSCPLGHYSWRHPERGSWFIQAVCKVFNKSAYEMELQQLFTTVAREVALNYQSNTTNIESNNKKQVTSTSSTLIRSVMFRAKVPNSDPRPPPVPVEQEIAISEETGVVGITLFTSLEEEEEQQGNITNTSSSSGGAVVTPIRPHELELEMVQRPGIMEEEQNVNISNGPILV